MKVKVDAEFAKDGDIVWGLVLRYHREEVTTNPATKRCTLEASSDH